MLNNKNLVFGFKKMRPLILQFKETMKCRNNSLPPANCSIFVKPFTTTVCNLIKYNSDNVWTDENFSKEYIKALKEPKIFAKGFYNLLGEFGKLYEEKKKDLPWNKFRCRNPHEVNVVDMLFTFDTEEDLNKFEVTADSAHCGGYSSASLKTSQRSTGLFTGNICSELIKDGEAKFAGYASMITSRVYRSFRRIKCYELDEYSHFVFKVRGDGRTYYVHFSVRPEYREHQNWVFSYPLFTRGGPHWQVSKIPFSDFYFITNGKFGKHQPQKVILNRITAIGLTVRQVDGPFKLEIDYIGLEKDRMHREISPYEQYA